VLIDAVQLRVWSQRTRRKIFRAIHQAGGTVRSRSRANGWNRRVGIRTQDVVVAVRSIVSETERCRGAEMLFDFESIVDGGCRLCIRLDPTALGSPFGQRQSGWKRRHRILLVWERRRGDDVGRIQRIDRAAAVADVVEEAVCHAGPQPNTRPALAKWIPSHARTWAKQPFLGVLRQQAITDHRFRQQNAAGPRNQIGGVVKFVVVAIRELVPQTQTQGQVRSKLDRVLYEPGAQPRAPRHHTRVELNRELRRLSLQKGFEAREDGLSPIEIELRILEPLEPDSGFQ